MTHVLLVEGQPDLRRLISEVLAFNGYEVLAVADGSSALDLLEAGRYRPSLILSDVTTKPVNGIHLLRAVRARPAWRYIPFILLSGSNQLAALYPDVLDRADGYVAKPFGIADLVSTVQSVMSARC